MSEIKSLEVVPFELEHLGLIKLRAIENRRYEYMKKYRDIYLKGPAYSVFDGDSLVFCGGVVIQWDGVGEGWLICNCDVKRYVREVYFYSDNYLERIIIDSHLHRVQATVPVHWGQGVRFLERLGFYREGLLRNYGPDKEDYYMFSRIR